LFEETVSMFYLRSSLAAAVLSCGVLLGTAGWAGANLGRNVFVYNFHVFPYGSYGYFPYGGAYPYGLYSPGLYGQPYAYPRSYSIGRYSFGYLDSGYNVYHSYGGSGYDASPPGYAVFVQSTVPQGAAVSTATPARLQVNVPDPSAEVWVDGHKTSSLGRTRY